MDLRAGLSIEHLYGANKKIGSIMVVVMHTMLACLVLRLELGL